MIRLNDEHLNDYIDNQLDASFLSDVKQALKEDEEALVKLNALRKVDNALREIKVDSAPDGFTERVMKLITGKSKSITPKISYFFVSIVSILCVAIFGVMFFAFMNTSNESQNSNQTKILDDALSFFKNNASNIQDFFSNDNVLMLGMFLTMLLLISEVFMLESHKKFKNKLNSIS